MTSPIVPTLVVGFGIVCFATAFITNFGGFMTIRVFLGLFEGGMMPGITYYLSTWYRRHELALRIGIFVSAASLSGAFGGLLATAFLSIPQLKGLYVLLYYPCLGRCLIISPTQSQWSMEEHLPYRRCLDGSDRPLCLFSPSS